MLKHFPDIATDNSRRPLRFFVEGVSDAQPTSVVVAQLTENPVSRPSHTRVEPQRPVSDLVVSDQSEHSLYPPVQRFLFQNMSIVSKRIRESTSSNRRGRYGNKWLHPDIVGMFVPGQGWNDLVRECASSLPTRKAKLVAVEVKLRLSASDVRESFFQAVSNSLWANRAYLAATEVKGEETLEELNTLASLHGVGYISIDPDNFAESRIVIPAREREEVDWASANRIAVENSDFRDYLKDVLNFLHSGHVMNRLWEYTDER